MGRGDHSKALGWLVSLAPDGEGGEQKRGKVSALGLLMLSSLVWPFVASRFVRPGWDGRQMSAFIKPTHPFAVSSRSRQSGSGGTG